MDREKVIKGLECCSADGEICPLECPYYFGPCYGFSVLMKDAIVLLKEQDAEIRQLRLALDIVKGTCNGIKVEGSVERNA